MDPYQGQLETLFSMRRTTRRRELSDIPKVLEALGSPEQTFPIVQVVGTNGKGSTAAFLASVMRSAGYRVGLFTSPHLIEFRERFRINNQPVADARLAPLLQQALQAWEALSLPPVFFDVVTVMAAQLFAQEGVDLAIFEAGMGARLDATTALPAALTILTQVGLDHCQWLGPSLEEIARDKAQGFRPHCPGVLGVTSEPVQKAIREETHKIQPSPLWTIGRDFPDLTKPTPSGPPELQWWYSLSPGLPGSFQKHNLSLALAAATLLQERFPASPESIKQGVQCVEWPGRMHRASWQNHTIWLDGAHNPSAMKALLANFEKQRPLSLVFGAMADKDIEALLHIASQTVDRFVLCPIQQDRALSPSQIKSMFPKHTRPETQVLCAQSLPDALQQATLPPSTGKGNPASVLVTGSLFLVGEALAWLRTLDRT